MEFSRHVVLGYGGLCQREGHIILKQSVTVHCPLLYFGLVSTKQLDNEFEISIA